MTLASQSSARVGRISGFGYVEGEIRAVVAWTLAFGSFRGWKLACGHVRTAIYGESYFALVSEAVVRAGNLRLLFLLRILSNLFSINMVKLK